MDQSQESGMAPPSFASLQADFRAWQERRLAELSAPDSWLGVIGLNWLEPGRNAVGSAAGSQVSVPGGAAHLGDLLVEDGTVVWIRGADGRVTVENPVGQGAGSGGVRLRTDAGGEPSRLICGDFVLFVIERDGRLAVRLRDLGWRRKRSFAGVECYPFDPAWRIEADWQELAQPMTMEVPNVTGELKPVTVSHRAVFAVAGVEYAMLPLAVDGDGVFFVFRDGTSGKETYGGGRFLRATEPKAGRLLIDFNRAYNPPCAFTPFATCPLPPPENRLPIPVRAGERKYVGAY